MQEITYFRFPNDNQTLNASRGQKYILDKYLRNVYLNLILFNSGFRFVIFHQGPKKLYG